MARPTDSSSPLLSRPTTTTGGTNLLLAPSYAARPSITHKYRPDGTQFRPITPLEAIYYHERLDLITHPLIKGLIKWKWDHFAAKYFYINLFLELLFLLFWTSVALITPFPIRYVYKFPQDIWRCILWAVSIGFLIWQIVQEMFDVSYARRRYEDYLIWESERADLRMDLISKNKFKPTVTSQISTNPMKKVESVAKINVDTGEVEHVVVHERPASFSTSLRSHHSQFHPLPSTTPTLIKGKPMEPLPSQQTPIDSQITSGESTRKRTATEIFADPVFLVPPTSRRRYSRVIQYAQRFRDRAVTRLKSYYMYYSLNNLFDWIVYILCVFTLITHFIDVGSHTVFRARLHMYIASITVLCMWFRFMVFFRTIIISVKTLQSKLAEIKLGELVIMVRMMFDDIIRFLMVFLFLLAPYAFVFYAVFGGQHILHNDYEKSPELCEHAFLHCSIAELQTSYDADSYRTRGQYVFNGSLSGYDDDKCSQAASICRIVEPSGFESFYSLLFSIFRIALVDDSKYNDRFTKT